MVESVLDDLEECMKHEGNQIFRAVLCDRAVWGRAEGHSCCGAAVSERVIRRLQSGGVSGRIRDLG